MNIERVIALLKAHYGKTFLQNREPFYVLISCILSHRTKDEVTYPAAKRLFKIAKNPKEMLGLSKRQIERAIFPVGFYKTKAKRIKDICSVLLKAYNGKVPNNFNELLKLKGVGRKTAGIVLTHGFGIPAMPIDTHCHRIANRLGWVKTRTPEQTERALMAIVPKRHWIELNELLVKHGQTICKPINPYCSKCFIARYCKKVGVKKSR